MAASDVALNIVLKATDQTKAGLDSAQVNLGKMEKATNLAQVAFHALTGVIAGELVGALSDAARHGADEEASLNRLIVAASNTAAGYDASALALKASIDVAHQYGFATIEVQDALALLTEQTGSADEAMKRILVAENLARGAHIDLYTASKLLGKATDENSNILGRYGIVIAKGADVTTMLGAVQAKFGGQAVEYGNSVAGSIDRTTVAIEDWTAGIGNSLGPAQKYIALLPGFASGIGAVGGAFFTATPFVVDHIGKIKELGATLATGGAVLLAIAAVAVALYEVGLTVQEVTDHWNTFIYALQTGRLNDIPVFGFFFSKIQQVMGAIQGAINLWNNLTSVFAGAQAMQQQANAISPNVGAAVRGYAAGGDFITNGPELIMVGERAREHVTITPAGQSGAGSVVVNINGDVVGLSKTELAQQLGAIYLQQRRIAGLA